MYNGSLGCVHVDCMISSPFINQSSSPKRERFDTYCNCMSQLHKRECENSLFQMDFSDKTFCFIIHILSIHHLGTCSDMRWPVNPFVNPFYLSVHSPSHVLYVTTSSAVDKSSMPLSTGSSIRIPLPTMYQKSGKLNNGGLLTVNSLPLHRLSSCFELIRWKKALTTLKPYAWEHLNYVKLIFVCLLRNT